MPTAEDFDEFYVSTRRGLVLQTFALTGDLLAARVAVRDAYVAAQHHWDKVSREADPESWVRPRAWAAAQRRHTVRPWHREKQITPEQTATLEALHELRDVQRRALVLVHLTRLTPQEIARELGQPLPDVADHVDAATAAVAAALDCPSTDIPARLEGLGTAADTVKLPRPPIIRRNGTRRRRNHIAVGSVLLAGTTVAAGAFVVVAAPAAPPPAAVSLVSQRMLLTASQVGTVVPNQGWTVASTGDNTEGDGKNNTCQASRFADDNGLGTWVRKFTAAGAPTRGLVQTVEISDSPGAARAAYETTLGWYAGCTAPRLQLLDAYRVTGVGDQAQVLRLRIPAEQDRNFVVGIARTGALTTTTVLETQASRPIAASKVTSLLASSVRNLCGSRVAGDCVQGVQTVLAPPPVSGETAGMLAIADLPVVGTVDKAWAGTDAADGKVNPAATSCDNANFAKAGARSLTRTFLIPEANLPARFGLTETIGTFPTAKAAAQFVDKVVAAMRACPDRELGSTVSQRLIKSAGPKATAYARWRLQSQVNKKQFEINYWLGIAREGRFVAQVNLTPVESYDISRDQFTALLVRARARLNELR